MPSKILLLLLCILFGCTPKVESVIFGSDLCDNCRMKIHDHRYGGAILTEKGKTYKFDSLECLLEFESKKLDKQEIVKERYAFNTFKKGELINVNQAVFLNVPKTRSPMGLGILSAESEGQILKVKAKQGGEVLNWEQLKDLLQSK